jgi:hypothetical protein
MTPSTAFAEASLAASSLAPPVGTAGLARRRRADVVVSYDLGVEHYEALWSPVILPAVAPAVCLLTGSGTLATTSPSLAIADSVPATGKPRRFWRERNALEVGRR